MLDRLSLNPGARCPDPVSCPVLHPGTPDHLESRIIEKGTSWFNVSRREEVFNALGVGDGRFTPLFTPDSRPIPHVYLAQNPVGALLETALHDVWGNNSAVQRCDLRGRCLRRLTCQTDLHVIDLMDHRLDRGRIRREELISSPSEHYACTRRWADPLPGAIIDGKPTTGMIWHSRQVEIAATHANAPMQILLTTVDQAALTAVIYDTADTGSDWFTTSIEYADLGADDGLALVTELATQLGLYVED